MDAENYTTETLTLDADGRTHILLASGETLRLIGLPEGAKWQVAEDENNYVTTVTPNPASGTVGSTVNPSVVFTNVPKAGVLALPIHKTVEGSTTQGAGIPFTFEIAAVTAEAPLPTPTTAMVTGAGTASFAPITFTHTGAYVYRVTETAGNAGGYQYDDTAYEVTVTVTDVDGQLTAAWTAKKGSETAEALTFTNTYSAAGSLRLTAAKQVKAAHRVYPQRQQPEAEKYFMRGWLLRMGFRGSDFKAARQALLKNLKGCSAFPDAEKAKRHQERWTEIRRQHREERLEQADEAQEEVTSDEKANV